MMPLLAAWANFLNISHKIVYVNKSYSNFSVFRATIWVWVNGLHEFNSVSKNLMEKIHKRRYITTIYKLRKMSNVATSYNVLRLV